jgi:hypothetical protein
MFSHKILTMSRLFGFIHAIVLIKHHLSLNGDQHELLSYPH